MTRQSLATMAALALAGTVLLTACGQDATPPASADATTTTVTTTATTTTATTAATTATHLPATDPLSTEEVQEIFAPLVERAVFLEGRLFNGSAYFYDESSPTIPPDRVQGVPYHLVEDNEFRSVADLKAYIDQTLTPECAQRTYYRRLDPSDKGALYRDYEGRLYVNTTAGGKGYGLDFLPETLTIQEQWADAIQVKVDALLRMHSRGTATFWLKKVEGEWRLDTTVYESVEGVDFPPDPTD